MRTKCAISDAFVRDCVFADRASVAQYVYSLSAKHCLKVRLHYAYKVRIFVRCIWDCAVALLSFCGLPTPQKRNGLFTLAWHRTEFDGCLRVIIVRHFEKSDIQFLSLISQHYFRINGNLKKYANIEIIWQTIHNINMKHRVQWTR